MPAIRSMLAIKWRDAVFLIICLLLWLYIIFRAATIPITEDEAHSYLLIKTGNWRQMAGTANTHWLNSLVAKILISLPGTDAMWKIRFLSIVTWPVYAYSSFSIYHRFNNKWIGSLFFLFAIANPFLVFYFSLSRGYAAACAFVMLALWKAFQLIERGEARPEKWMPVFVFAAIAALANFSAFYFFLALNAAYLLILIKGRQLSLLFKGSAVLFLMVVSGASLFAVGSLFFMRYHDTLYFGGNARLVDSVFGSMVKAFSYFENAYVHYKSAGTPYLLSDALSTSYRSSGWIVFILLCIASMLTLWNYQRTKSMSKASFALLICLLILALNLLFHLLFKTPYLLERTALIVYPPLIAGLCYAFDLTWKRRSNYLLATVTIIAVFILSLNFARSFSTKTFKEWPVQTDTKAGLDYLQQANASTAALNVWHHDVLVNYYLLAYPSTYKFSYVVLPDKLPSGSLKNKTLTCDFLFILPPYYSSIDLADWELVASFPASGSRIYRKKLSAAVSAR
jgi:hypothetical protein